MREQKSKIDRKICIRKSFVGRSILDVSNHVQLGCALSVSAGKTFAAQGISRFEAAVKICYQRSVL